MEREGRKGGITGRRERGIEGRRGGGMERRGENEMQLSCL